MDRGVERSMTGSLTARVRSVSKWSWLVVVMCLAHATWISSIQIETYRSLGTFSYDVGLYDQGLWLMSRGRAPFVTLMGRNLFGDHASFILIFLVPLYWVVPGTATLLVVQAIVIAAGAFPIYLIARDRLGSEPIGVVFALAWLVNPAVNGTNLENFHPDAFLGLLVPLAIYAALGRKWRLYAVSVVLCLMVKEDVLLLLIPLGLYVAARLDRRKGYLTVLASMMATIVGMFMVMRTLTGVPTRNGWRIPFGGLTGLAREVITRPMNVARYLWSEDRPLYLFQMIAPFAGLSILAPSMMLVAVPVMASNMISTFWYQHSIQYHYSIIVVPVLVGASIMGVEKLTVNFKKLAVSCLALCSIGSGFLWSTHPLSLHPRATLSAQSPAVLAGRDIIERVPDGAVLSVYDALTTHATHRREIYFFPNPFSALYYGTDPRVEGTRLPAADRVEYVVLPRIMDPGLGAYWDKVKGEFYESDSNEYWQIFRRRDG